MNDITLSTQAIIANISYYESLAKESQDIWQQHLVELQYWLDQLEKRNGQ
jgi:hypothetical protein